MAPCLYELQLLWFWEVATHGGLALNGLTKHKQDQTKAKYDHKAHISGSSGVLMVHKSKTKMHQHTHKQAQEFVFH